tara:strand:- start:551 stop:1294 length:744 start_codon:yes stop_codon:yes gene_type:complete
MVKIQVCSNLNIKSYKDLILLKENNTKSDILIIPGNIVINMNNYRYIKFLNLINNNYKKSIIIMGISEYYNNGIDEMKMKIKKKLTTKYTNIIFVIDDMYEDEEYIFYGYTLWSKIDCVDQVKIINNTKLQNICYKGNKKLCVSKIIDLYYNSIEDIKNKIKNSKKIKILITNFIPVSSNFIKENIGDNEFDKKYILDKNLIDFYFNKSDICDNFDICCFNGFSNLFFKNNGIAYISNNDLNHLYNV